MECLCEWRVESSFKTKHDINMELVHRLRDFLEREAHSCSMDYGAISPEYVFRMWGGTVSIEDIKEEFKELQKQGIPVVVK